MKRILLTGTAMFMFALCSLANPIIIKQDKTLVRLPYPVDTAAARQAAADVFLASITGSNGVKLNKRAVSYVQDYMEKNMRDLLQIRENGKAAIAVIDRVLAQYDLPAELKYLAMIESEFKPSAVSHVGAVGTWQLMAATARDLGLTVKGKVDERRNCGKSTHAAALYLRDLYGEFGDWLLVIAAYNSGTAAVYRAMKKSGSNNFWALQNFLPAESRTHVKKFIATQYALEGKGSVTTLTKKEAAAQLSGSEMMVFNRKMTPEEASNSLTMKVSGKYYAKVISGSVLMDQETFDRFNPDFDKVMASANNSYDLKLPAEKMDLFLSNKYQILNDSVQQLTPADSTEGASSKSVATAR